MPDRSELIDDFERMAGKKLSVIKVYQAFDHEGFYEHFAEFICCERGAFEFVSFDPTFESSGDLNACEVLSGDYDSIVVTFAQQIKRWGRPLMLSSIGEMNGTWAGWSGALNFGSDCVPYTQVSDLYGHYGCIDANDIGCADGPERYRDVFRHIHDIFEDEGVTNVAWVWVVNHEPFPKTDWNQFDNYYPGDEYVDIISVDGYNWGDDGPGGCPVDVEWKSFNQVFSAALTSLSSTHYPTKPLIIGEFASAEGTDPMSKATWITDAFESIKSDWPQIKAVVWYNPPGDCSFPVTSSLESTQAYSQALADPYFIGTRVCCPIYLPIILKNYWG